jgi:hypothetical protein
MRADDLVMTLRSLVPADGTVSAAVETDGDVAQLRLTRGSRWAVVSTPGDWWCLLSVDGGFSTFELEREPSDDEVRAVLTRFVNLAVHYLAHGGTPVRRPWPRSRTLRLQLPETEVVLSRVLGARLRRR